MEAMTKQECSLCECRHPASQGIVHYTREFECSECGETWTDTWCSDCNDKCPNCNAEIEPSETTDEEVIEEPVMEAA